MAALRVGKRLGIPVLYEIRAFWEDAAVGNGTGREHSARYYLTRTLETRAVKAADAVAVICDGLRGDLIARGVNPAKIIVRSEEHTSELQSLMRISYAVFCLKKKKRKYTAAHRQHTTNTA